MRVKVEDSIKVLDLDADVIKILSDNSISIVDELWSLKIKDLKAMNFSSSQINHIIVKMQLKGMDLNRKKY